MLAPKFPCLMAGLGVARRGGVWSGCGVGVEWVWNGCGKGVKGVVGEDAMMTFGL